MNVDPLPDVATEPSVNDESSQRRPTPVAGARNAKDLGPLVSLITNVVFMTAAVTAGMMHALAKDHGGRATSPRVTAFVQSSRVRSQRARPLHSVSC
eukprot:6185038-Pleurochrysis_carterae.AAC.2